MHFSQRNIICGKKIQDLAFLQLHGSFHIGLRIRLPLDGMDSIDFLDSFQVDFGIKLIGRLVGSCGYVRDMMSFLLGTQSHH